MVLNESPRPGPGALAPPIDTMSFMQGYGQGQGQGQGQEQPRYSHGHPQQPYSSQHTSSSQQPFQQQQGRTVDHSPPLGVGQAGGDHRRRGQEGQQVDPQAQGQQGQYGGAGGGVLGLGMGMDRLSIGSGSGVGDHVVVGNGSAGAPNGSLGRQPSGYSQRSNSTGLGGAYYTPSQGGGLGWNDSGSGYGPGPGLGQGQGVMGMVYEHQEDSQEPSGYPQAVTRRSSGYSFEEGNERLSGSGTGLGGSGFGFTPMLTPHEGSLATHPNNPYFTSAASEYHGLAPPPPPAPGGSGSGSGSGYPSTLGVGGPSRSRTLRTVSSTSEISLHRTPTTSIGSSKAKRKGISAAIDVTKPPYTKEFVDDYRARMKMDPDPEAQFAFARYLIEAARKIGEDMSATDPRAGKRYRDGLLAESLKVLKRLAAEGGAGKGEGGYPEAQFFLANMFGTGQLGLAVDHEKAYQLYMQASKANHPAATYRTAVCNELGAGTRKEVNRAVLFYRKAATLRDTAAMYKLAMILLTGSMGQAPNPREGVTWLRRAAAQADEDNPHALHELAMIHEDPRGMKIHPSVCPPSIDIARDLYTQAAQLGYAPAMYKLGVAHEHGHLGCPVDPRRSIAWLSRAAEKGDPEAALALSGWFLTGAEGVLKQDDQEAFLWARKAATKGLPKAEFALGRESMSRVVRGVALLLTLFTHPSDYIEAGIGVPQNLEMAKSWYLRAAGKSSSYCHSGHISSH